MGKFIFGPVPSRRLGLSLGVDIVPRKHCTLNCVYCEAGKTTDVTLQRQSFYEVSDIIEEFSAEYEKVRDNLDVVTVTGCGEPGLNSDLGEIIRRIKEISVHPVAILTNSTLLTEADVSEQMLELDIAVPSIDAASQEVFQKIDQPHRNLKIADINQSLIEFTMRFGGKVYLELLLVKGINDTDEELSKIADVVNRCTYNTLQLNTVHRPPAFSGYEGLSEAELLDVFLFMKKKGVKVESISAFSKSIGAAFSKSLPEAVVRLLTMRPCTKGEMGAVFGESTARIDEVLEELRAKYPVSVYTHEKNEFYFIRT